MKLRLSATAILSLAAMAALPASAQNMKPGLWEVNNKMQSDNGQLAQQMEQMQKQLAAMPPAQRKQMEEMMTKHSGLAMPTMKDGAMVVKLCMTKEMVAQNHVPVQTQGNCTNQRSPMMGNTMKMSFSCTKPDSSGEGTIQFMGDSAYKMNMKMSSAMSGKPETITMDASGKWLAADCGNIKPLPIPK